MTPEFPTSPVGHLRCVELTSDWEAELQRFFEANPAYFMEVHGEPPREWGLELVPRDRPEPGNAGPQGA